MRLRILLFLVLQLSSTCSAAKCEQSGNYIQELSTRNGPIKKTEENKNNTKDNSVAATFTIKYRLSARHLSGTYYQTTPKSYCKVYNDGSTSKITSQNPDWGNTFSVEYTDGQDKYIKFEVWDEYRFLLPNQIIGATIVHVKSMLCKNRVIESPLWKKSGYFHTGVLLITTIEIPEGSSNCDDE